MPRSIFGVLMVALGCAVVALTARADGIIVEGVVYSDIKLYETSQRYYWRIDTGEAMSASKSAVRESDVWYGERPIPAPEPPAVPQAQDDVPPVTAPESIPAPEAAVADAPPMPVPAPGVPESVPPVLSEATMEPDLPAATAPAEGAPLPIPMPDAAESTPEPAIPESVPADAPSEAVVVPEPTRDMPVAVQQVEEGAPVSSSASESFAEETVDTESATAPTPAEVLPPEVAKPALPELAEAVRPVLPDPAPLFAGTDREALESPSGALCEINTLVLKSGEQLVAFCALDRAAHGEQFVAAVVEELRAAGSEIDGDNLVLTATGVHTNLFGGVAGSKVLEAQLGAMAPETLKSASNQVAQSILRAEAAITPASILNSERDAPQFHVRQGGDDIPLDSALGVLCVQDGPGKTRGLIVNYALQPPVGFGEGAQETAGVPGELRDALRARWGEETAVLFINGAAGDALPALTGEHSEGIAEGMASLVMEMCDQGQARDSAALWVQAYDRMLPPSLLEDLVQTRARIHEVWLDRTLLIGCTGLPSGEMGMLVRVNALQEGADSVFLLSQSGAYSGYHPTIEVYWTNPDAAKLCFYGPLMVSWYGANLLPYRDDSVAVWDEVPTLAPYATAFRRGMDIGAAQAEVIGTAWIQTAVGLDGMVKVLEGRLESIPEDMNRMLKQMDEAEALLALKQFVAIYLRTEQEEISYPAEQRALLMGIAEGANRPFDQIYLLQLLGRRDVLPREVNAIIHLVEQVNKVTMPGLDLLAL